MGIRERTAQADWAEAAVSADAPLRVHAAYTASLAAQWQAAREFTPCKSVHPLYRFLCRLPRNHRSEEHWHPAVTWFDEPEAEDMIP